MPFPAQYWKLNSNGNAALCFGKAGCTVFATRDGDYSYVIDGEFSKATYNDLETAKSEAEAAIDDLLRKES